MTKLYKTKIEDKKGKPVTGLKFKDFESNKFLDDKTCLLEINAGEYLFFKNKRELIEYKIENKIKLSALEKINVMLKKL